MFVEFDTKVTKRVKFLGGLGSFGSPNTSGAQPTLGLNFGAASTSATPSLNFGATSSSGTGLSLGLTTTSAGLGFGTTTTASTALNFGKYRSHGVYHTPETYLCYKNIEIRWIAWGPIDLM